MGGAPERAPLVDRILESRGITGPGAASFLDPSLKDLHDPSRMPDLDRAAARLFDAARAGERIVIYGDYDVDGISASAILFHTLRHLVPGANVSCYIPHRLDEGYGLNEDAVASLADEGAAVIVTVDCGVTAVGPAAVAKARGVDLIITDHHTPPATEDLLPDAYAVVHPRRPGSLYPFGDLSGSAVAFKLAWRLATLACGGTRTDEPTRALLLELLGLASLGVIADVVPLVGENRVIARFGLSRLRGSRFPGLSALIEASGLSGGRVEAEHVGYRLGPRLNACGRLGHAREALELLTTATGARAAEIAAALTALNDERREVERRITEHAERLAVEAGMTTAGRRAIVLAHEDWHQGVVGIACSRLVGRFHRPTILMQRHGDECHGSGRSIDGFSLHGALDACRGHLIGFGGHDMAAGVRVRADRVRDFAEAFIEEANRGIAPEQLAPALTFDTEAGADELTVAAAGDLARVGPFGRDNPKVRVVLRGAVVIGRPKLMGATGEHASLQVRHSGRVMRVVAFSWAARLAELPDGVRCDLMIEPTINRWNGTASVEGELVDLAMPPARE